MTENNNGHDGTFGNNSEETRKLKQTLKKVNDKLTGKIKDPLTLEDVGQFLRVINYNFLQISNVLSQVLINQHESFTSHLLLESKLEKIKQEIKGTNDFFNAVVDDNESESQKN